MKTKPLFNKTQEYMTPDVRVFSVETEGCLCASEGDSDEGADAGYFGENEW